jgi:hypothetical protein
MMKRGIQAEYRAYCWCSNPDGYQFDFVLAPGITVHGEGFATPDERDLKAIEVAKELGIILDPYLLHKDYFVDEKGERRTHKET